jgi:hypothetical protein
MTPSWVVLPEAKTADGTLINPTVFYKVQIGIQSPNGITAVQEYFEGLVTSISLLLFLSSHFQRNEFLQLHQSIHFLELTPVSNSFKRGGVH